MLNVHSIIISSATGGCLSLPATDCGLVGGTFSGPGTRRKMLESPRTLQLTTKIYNQQNQSYVPKRSSLNSDLWLFWTMAELVWNPQSMFDVLKQPNGRCSPLMEFRMCSGAMINVTLGGVFQGDGSVVTYWNYENSFCREHGIVLILSSDPTSDMLL